MDGTMDVWDYCHNQSKPVVSLTLSDCGLYSIKASVGKYIAVGAADGSVSFLELSEDLSEKTSSDEKKIFSDMLERVARQDKILESSNASKNRMDSVVDVSKLDEMLEQLQSSISKEQETVTASPLDALKLTDQQIQEIEEEFHKEVQLSKEEFSQRSAAATSTMTADQTNNQQEPQNTRSDGDGSNEESVDK